MTLINGTKQSQLRRGQPSIRKISNAEKIDTKKFQNHEFQHQEFTILKTLDSGVFSKIYLARPELGSCKKQLEQALVLKAFNSDLTNAEDFAYELELNYFLSPHPNIVTSYNVPFTWNNFHIFPQEYAPYGNLWKFIRRDGFPTPLPESQVKLVAQQLSCALEFIHGLNLVHRDVVPDNVLVFQKDLSLIKLSDFGSMVPARALLTKSNNDVLLLKTQEKESAAEDSDTSPKMRPRVNSNPNVTANTQGCGKLSYLPPEFCGILPQEKYHCYPSFDVWQVGILLFACLMGGCTPWRCADILKDQGFNHYCDWVKRKSIKTPGAFQSFSPRLMRLLKRMLEPKPNKRCDIQEICKYLKDDWIEMKKSTSVANLSAIGTVKVQSTIKVNGDQKCLLKRSTAVQKRKSDSKTKKNGSCCGGISEVDKRQPVFRIVCTFQSNKNQQNIQP